VVRAAAGAFVLEYVVTAATDLYREGESMPRRIDTAPVLALASALLLIVSLFLDWFSPDDSAWTAFEAWDLVLACVAVAAVLLGVRALGPAGTWPGRTEGTLPVLGAVALVIVASQLLNPPPAAQDRELEVGAWLGFVGAVALAIAGVMSAARVSFEVAVRSRRGGAAGPGGAGAPPAGTPREGTPPEDTPTTPLGEEPPSGAPPGEPAPGSVPAAEPPAPGEAPERGRRPPGEPV
jgi:hypothetical protein